MARSNSTRKLNTTSRFKYQPNQPNDANDAANRTWPSFFSGAGVRLGGIPLKDIPVIFRTASDTLTITDEASPGRESYDTLTISDAVTRTTNLLRTTADSFSITDVASQKDDPTPTLVGVGTFDSTTTGPLNPGLPVGWAENDIFIITHYSNTATSVPSGYTQIGTRQDRTAVYWRRATSSESDPSIADGGNACARVAAIRGCIQTGDPFEGLATGTHASSDTLVTTGVTTLGSNRLVWSSVGRRGDVGGNQFDHWQGFSLDSVTEQFDNGFTLGLGGGITAVSGKLAYAGFGGPFLSVLANNNQTGWIEFGLIPDPVKRTADSLTISDSVTRAVTNLRDTTDSITITDVVTTTKTLFRTASDSIGISDTASRSSTSIRTTVDSVGISDLINRSEQLVRTSNDSLAISDSADQFVGTTATSDDSLTISDTATRTVQANRTSSDTFTISDVAVAARVISRTASDSITLSDSATRVTTAHRTTSDSVSITDSATQTGGTGGGGATTEQVQVLLIM